MTESRVNIPGLLKAVRRSIDRMTPLFEAMSNAIEATLELPNDIQPEIILKVYKTGLNSTELSFDGYKISDNGVGFNEANFERFNEAFDRSKGYNNRGSGRVQFLHSFETIRYNSQFLEDGKLYSRSFFLTQNSFSDNDDISPHANSQNTGTSLKLITPTIPKHDLLVLSNYDANDFKNQIINRFVLRLHQLSEGRNYEPNILIEEIHKGEVISNQSITKADLITPIKEESFKLYAEKPVEYTDGTYEFETDFSNSKQLTWSQFKMPSSKNSLNIGYLCSKGMPVRTIPIEGLSRKEDFDGHRYMTLIHGDFFDDSENVSDSLDEFKFPTREQIYNSSLDLYEMNSLSEFTYEAVIETSSKELSEAYNHLRRIKEDKQLDATLLATKYGLPIRLVKRAGIFPDDDEKKIIEKLYDAQASDLSKKAVQTREALDKVKNIDPTAPDYQKKLKSTIRRFENLVHKQDKEELARYIIRRKLVIDLLDHIQSGEIKAKPRPNSKRSDKEGLIHEILFRRNSTSSETINDLWLVDEDFIHFDSVSDKPLWKITDSKGNKLLRTPTREERKRLNPKTGLRPDIFLFSEEEQCLLIELKAKDIDIDEYTSQLEKYATVIANFSKHRITKFHLYLIGGKIDLYGLGTLRSTHYGSYVSKPIPVMKVPGNTQEIASYTLEVMDLDTFISRARSRNKIFASKLGLLGSDFDQNFSNRTHRAP